MPKLTVVASTLVLATTTALAPTPANAAAAVEMGNACTVTGVAENTTLLMVAKDPGNPLPIVAPSGGVITTARITMPPLDDSPGFPQKLKVARATGAPGQYTIVGESGVLPVVSGPQTFDVRVPIAAGDLLGLQGGTNGAAYCNAGPASTVAVLPGDPAVGSTATYTSAADVALSLVVTLEPDADKDGFGDVSQDKCPQSASTQSECPVVKLDSFSIARDGSIVVLLNASEPAKVKVTGKATVDGKVVKLSGKSKRVKPGKFGQVRLSLPAALRTALARLPSNAFIKVAITASATDVAGRKSKDTSSVKLYGTR